MKRKIHYVSLINQPEQGKKPKNGKRKAQTIAFCTVLFIGMVISLIIPLRPTVSASEKRELAKFPEFSFQALISGDYFDAVDTWFSDTFPFREMLTGLNTKLTSWYGFGDKVSSIDDIGGDEIPDVPTRPADNEIADSDETTQASVTTSETESTTGQATENTTEDAENTTETAADKTEAADSTEKTTEDTTSQTKKPVKTETLGGVLVAGKAAYEYYNFVQSTADRYIKVINRTAKKLSDKATVYDIIVPTSIDITLDDRTRKSVSSSDQKKAIEYFFGSMNKKVKTVNIYDTLKSHRKEYIYYRTDHHWTALGAYYGYTEFAKISGKTPVDINKFEKVSYGEFLGSFYGDTRQNKTLKKNADELIAYKPNYSTTLEYTDNRGNKYTWPIVNDVSAYNTAYKYSCFAAGDQPYVRIVNNDISSKDKCVVVKESFGNAMIPFIAGNYKKVYVLDYRYWKGDFFDFIEKKGINDVIFINNMSATRNAALIDDLSALCK